MHLSSKFLVEVSAFFKQSSRKQLLLEIQKAEEELLGEVHQSQPSKPSNGMERYVSVRVLELAPIDLTVTYSGLISVQGARVEVKGSTQYDVGASTLGALIHQDLRWRVMRQIVSQAVSRKVKTFVRGDETKKKMKITNSAETADEALAQLLHQQKRTKKSRSFNIN